MDVVLDRPSAYQSKSGIWPGGLVLTDNRIFLRIQAGSIPAPELPALCAAPPRDDDADLAAAATTLRLAGRRQPPPGAGQAQVDGRLPAAARLRHGDHRDGATPRAGKLIHAGKCLEN